MTFDPHPMEVVHPGSHPAQLTTLTRRAELAEEFGIDVFLVMPFTADFMKLTPGALRPRVAGRGPARGRSRGGGEFHLRQEGWPGRSTPCAVPARGSGSRWRRCRWFSEHHNTETVTFSSTYIRSCVDAGDVVAATEALGRPHRVEGVVVRGDGRGTEMGFPTANVAPPMYSAIPADGVYAAWFTVLGHGPVTGTVVPGERYQAAVSVGTNPTFSGRTRTVEAFVLDTAADLYGQHVALDFVARDPWAGEVRLGRRPRRRDGHRYRACPQAAFRYAELRRFTARGRPAVRLPRRHGACCSSRRPR